MSPLFANSLRRPPPTAPPDSGQALRSDDVLQSAAEPLPGGCSGSVGDLATGASGSGNISRPRRLPGRVAAGPRPRYPSEWVTSEGNRITSTKASNWIAMKGTTPR